MSEKTNEESNNKNPNDLNESNEDGEILTLSDLLNEQREIDEVSCCFFFPVSIYCFMEKIQSMWINWMYF